jgi:leucyl aminopeptidase
MLDVRILSATAGLTSAAEAQPVDEHPDPAIVRESAGRLARELPPGRTILARPGLSGPRLTAFVEGLVLGSYRFTAGPPSAARPTTVELAGVHDRAAVDAGLRNASAGVWARDLANTPSDVKTPAWLGVQARRRLSAVGVQVAVHDEAWLADRGFGGVLAVGGGSASPPRLIAASWRPRGSRPDVHAVLVGKGITFDTGGLNLKQGDGMKWMKTDMAGGAAVLAALWLAAAQRVPFRVTALVPVAENSVSGSSYRPGDVVRHVGGRTSEIGNTDAEGRLVLADAIAYAVARLRPTVLVDVATLTGAMRISLGLRTGGLFATSGDLAGALWTAGAAAGEPLWRLPLVEEYESALASPIADATNAPGQPGAITAALFLRPFAADVPWAHLDIAGPARATAEDGLRSTGATGFGARLLGRWLEAIV